MKRIMFLLVIYVSLGLPCIAQDQLFTQFYNSPLTLNPAFAGCAKNGFRACLSSRAQWLKLSSPLQSYTVSVDKFFPNYDVSVGVLANVYNEESYIKRSEYSVIAAKNFQDVDNVCGEWFINFAAQGGIGIRSADRNNYLFADQIGANGPNGQASQAELFAFNNKTYLDLSFGVVGCYRNLMAGFTAYHLNSPSIGLIGTDQSQLPRRYVFHISYINDDKDDRVLLWKPTAIFQLQGSNKQFMIGSLINVTNTPFEIGIWYKNNLSLQYSNSFSVGINIDISNNKVGVYNSESGSRFRLGANYDAELTSPKLRYTGGSTEIGALYEAGGDICPKAYNVPSCPTSVRYPWVFF